MEVKTLENKDIVVPFTQEIERLPDDADRQERVLHFKIRGATNFQIAQELGVSLATVGRDLKALREKEVNEKLQAILGAFDPKIFWREEMSTLEAMQRKLWASVDKKNVAQVSRALLELRREYRVCLKALGLPIDPDSTSPLPSAGIGTQNNLIINISKLDPQKLVDSGLFKVDNVDSTPPTN